jgi:alginate O-acetyltransferase complex protein AlgI
MLFNTLQFAVFFIIVYSLYLAFNHKWQNRMLLIASYIFYGSWDWRFLSLIWISTVLDYFCGIIIHESNDIKKRKLFLFFSILGNLLILGCFKYFNFFAENLQAITGIFGLELDPVFLRIILPVGISFYTFQTMSYTIDVYYKKMKPTKRFFDFALFVAFFPQLVAGPIERAKHLLPQMLSPRKVNLDKFYEGCYLILWGLFLKVFVADNLARIVDPVFASNGPYNGVRVLLALYAFAFQIFCDFAGYSNIARGLGKVMGFDIMVNFNLPYFAVNPSEFWRRWHISLSTWLRDYLYIPLGGNKKGTPKTYRNLAITMLLGGLWHGAAWTFVIWGAYQGMLLVIHRLMKPLLEKTPSFKNAFFKNIWFFLRVLFFFQLICLGWLIFRAESLEQIFSMLKSLLCNFTPMRGIGIKTMAISLMVYAGLLLWVQVFQFVKKDLMVVYKSNLLIKVFFYCICWYLMTIFGVVDGAEFIYFQF